MRARWLGQGYGKVRMKRLGLLALACAALAQTPTPKAERKVYQPPEYVLVDPLVAKDEGCAKDLAKAAVLEGLEQRKLLADLFLFGCIQIEDGTYRANLTAVREYGDPPKKVQVRRVYLISSATGKSKEGWILANQLLDVAALRKIVQAVEAEKKK